jgi:hypothetical protein
MMQHIRAFADADADAGMDTLAVTRSDRDARNGHIMHTCI